MTIRLKSLAVLFAFCVFAGGAHAAEAPVNFDADQLLYDDKAEVVTAIGHVRLEQEGRVITADSILYNLKEDKVTAVGNVILTEVDGSVYKADKVQLRERFQQGYVSYLSGVLPDGGRFSSRYAERRQEHGDEIVMHGATYTSCEPCKKNPDNPPTWQIKAERVTHQREKKQVSYNNASLELGGVPVLYTPYFSHPDGSEDQKSGLVEPVLGYDSELGGYGGVSYYYAIAPDKDATIGLTAYSRELPILNGQYRQRFEDAVIDLSGTTTYSNRVVSIGGVNTELDDELRGNIEASGRWDINREWRGGFDVNLTSDDQYLRQYDLSDEDILENQLYVERFSGRDYVDARLIGFQDTRLISEQTDSPNILPEINLSFMGAPGDTLGGRWAFDMSALSLQRDGSAPDTNRLTTKLGWQGHRKMASGLVSTLDLNVRGDYYYLTDQAGRGDFNETRAAALGNLETSYPLIKPVGQNGGSIILEPLVSVTLATRNNDQANIANEDSQDSQISVNNLFDEDRFTGYDRIEDQSRVAYGVRSAYHTARDFEISAFAGQSYNFEERASTFFGNDSGLNEQNSDYVGELNLKYKDRLDVNYRTQLDGDKFSSKRHEVDARYQGRRLEIGGLYFYSKGAMGTDFTETREQIRGSGRLRLSNNWYASSGAAYDLGTDPGLREADIGLEYVGECLSVGSFIQRDLTNDNSGDADTEISIRIGLKSLGNFEASSTILSNEED